MPAVGAVMHVHARRGAAAPEQLPDRLRLRGEVEWLVTGPSAELAQLTAALAGVCEPLGDTLALLSFGNAVGLFQVPHLGTVEVVSGKRTEQDFGQMLADLTAVASALPFAAAAPAALPYDRSLAARDDVLYHAFVYLRHVLSAAAAPDQRLLPALFTVLREPHRQFARVRESVPLAQAHRLDAASLVGLVSGRAPLLRVAGAPARLSLAQRLHGHLPAQVDQAAVLATVDTPENRFVKTFLQGALGLTEAMRQVVAPRAATAFTRRILDDCAAMERALRPVVRHPLWPEVGPMVHLPAASPVLQRRRGYREVFRHFARLRLAARVPLAKGLVWDLLETRDIAQLYELWCYFTLVRLLESLLGPAAAAGRPQATPLQLIVPWDLEVRWPNGTRLFYNPRFSRARPAARHSYSVPLRPDVGLEVPEGPNAGLHLFDAKFRLESIDTILAGPAAHAGDDEAAEDVADERRGTFKRGDLYKMHTYRDAIPNARSVWVLYPGTEVRFFAENGTLARGALPALPSPLDGVGAVPAVPAGDQHTELRAVLAAIAAAPPPPGLPKDPTGAAPVV